MGHWVASEMTTLAAKHWITLWLPQLDEDRLAWLALALSPGLGPKRILDAVSELEAPSQIFTHAADGAGGTEVSGDGGAVHF